MRIRLSYSKDLVQKLTQLAEQIKPSHPSLKDKPDNARWVEMAKVGRYKGGKVALTTDDFQSIVQNFNNEDNIKPIFEGHEDVENDGAKAVGYIRAVVSDKTSLWGFVEYTEQAKQEIKNGNWLSCSVHIAPAEMSGDGKSTGMRLISLALTNIPAVDGLMPISLSEEKIGEKDFSVYLIEKIEETNLMADQVNPDNKKEEDKKEGGDDALTQVLAALKDALGAEVDAAGAVALLRDPAVQDALKKYNSKDEATDSPVESKAPEVQASQKDILDALSAYREENETLKAQLSALQKPAEEKSVDSILEDAVKVGKVKPGERAFLKSVALSNRKLFDDEMSNRKADPKFTDKTQVSVTLSDHKIESGSNEPDSEFAKRLKKRAKELMAKSKN